MGFRFKRFDYIGGVAPFDGGSSEQTNRAIAVLKDFANFITSCGKGWSLDTSKNATVNDYINVPQYQYNGTLTQYIAQCLFFINTNGSKLFLCVSGLSGWCGPMNDNQSLLCDVPFPTFHNIFNGIIMSMIPAKSISTWGTTFDNTFLPSDATFIVGTTQQYVNEASWKNLSYVCAASSGIHYSYGLFVDEDCIGIGGGMDSSAVPTIRPGYFCGRIFGDLAHRDMDNQLQAKYGVIKFTDNCNNYSEENVEFKYYLSAAISSAIQNPYGCYFSKQINTNTSSSSLQGACSNGMFFKANGARIDGRTGANVRFYPHTGTICTSKMYSVSGSVKWVPIEAGVVSNDLANDGVVPGDGFKGWLDTDRFRFGGTTLNALYNDGVFICADADHSLLLGWDPSNEDTL